MPCAGKTCVEGAAAAVLGWALGPGGACGERVRSRAPGLGVCSSLGVTGGAGEAFVGRRSRPDVSLLTSCAVSRFTSSAGAPLDGAAGSSLTVGPRDWAREGRPGIGA